MDFFSFPYKQIKKNFQNGYETTDELCNDELINKLQNTSNELINRNNLSVEITELSNKILETLKIIGNCTSCKEIERNDLDNFHKSINKIENCLVELEKEKWIDELIDELIEINIRLNKAVLCEVCKEKEIRKLTDKCENKEIARVIYECKLNPNYYGDYIQWIPFNELKNIGYLAKGGFGEIHKATWFTSYYDSCKEKYVEKRCSIKKNI